MSSNYDRLLYGFANYEGTLWLKRKFPQKYEEWKEADCLPETPCNVCSGKIEKKNKNRNICKKCQYDRAIARRLLKIKGKEYVKKNHLEKFKKL